MKKMFGILFAAVAVAVAAEPAPSREWVRRYVAGVMGTNRTASVTIGSKTYSASYETCSVYALVATNSVHSTITNGVVFAYVDAGRYTNGVVGAGIQATPTNLVWNGVGSSVVNGIDTFANGFGVFGTLITPTHAEALR